MILIPRIITINPAIMLMYLNTSPIILKVTEKIMLKIIKIVLKPKMKLTVLAIGLGLFSLSCDTGAPPIIDNQDGISGSTQGEKNDNNPALKAIITDRFSLIIFPYLSLPRSDWP